MDGQGDAEAGRGAPVSKRGSGMWAVKTFSGVLVMNKQWARFVGILVLLPAVSAYIGYLVFYGYPEKPEIEQVAQAHLEQLEQEYSSPEMICRQLPERELRFPGRGEAEVLCETNRNGFFQWYERAEDGWLAMLRGRNSYPADAMGFLFTTLPDGGLVRIVFTDMYCNGS